MGLRKGENMHNQNAKGHGRKSAFQEKADADLLWDVFTKEYPLQEIKEMASGTKSGLKALRVKVAMGNERFVELLVKKLFPDQLNIQGNLKQKSMERLETDFREILSSIKKNANKRS